MNELDHQIYVLCGLTPGRGMANDRSEQCAELFLGEAGLADEGAERAFGKFTVVGNGQPAARWVTQNNMAAGLMVHFITEFAEGFDRVCTGTDGQAAHTKTSTISSATGLGIGSLCFSKLWR